MKHRTPNGRRSLRRIYFLPVLIALVSALGLTSALLEDGVFDVISWLALGLVVLVLGVAVARRQR